MSSWSPRSRRGSPGSRVRTSLRPPRRSARDARKRTADAPQPRPCAGLFELRFHCQGVPRRITYWFAPSRRIVLLTTFRKQRDNERREIERARTALRRCAAEHAGEEQS